MDKSARITRLSTPVNTAECAPDPSESKKHTCELFCNEVLNNVDVCSQNRVPGCPLQFLEGETLTLQKIVYHSLSLDKKPKGHLWM